MAAVEPSGHLLPAGQRAIEAVVAQKDFAGQVAQVAFEEAPRTNEYVLLGHGVGKVEFSRQKLPIGQIAWVAGVVQKYPAAHGTEMGAPAGQYVVSKHGVGAVEFAGQ
jgi:hypothetical protein